MTKNATNCCCFEWGLNQQPSITYVAEERCLTKPYSKPKNLLRFTLLCIIIIIKNNT